MGDGFQLRFSSVSHGALPDPNGSDLQGGTRFGPRLRLSLGDFEVNLRMEAAFTNAGTSGIGSKFWDSQPSSSLSARSPMSFWEYQPESDTDRFSGNMGLRQLSLTYRPHQDFRISLGPHRWDITESENFCMNGSYSSQCKFAFVSFPMGPFGGELAYDRERDDGIVRRAMTALVSEATGFGGFFIMGHGLLTFALGDGTEAPQLTLYGYASAHDNPQSESEHLVAPGFTHAEGGFVQFDYDIFRSGVFFSSRFGQGIDALGQREESLRQVTTGMVEVHPGDFRIRGMLSYLTRQDLEGPMGTAPQGRDETHMELNVGYNLMDGLLLSAGYRGAYGGETPVHMGFLGLRTDLRHTFPF